MEELSKRKETIKLPAKFEDIIKLDTIMSMDEAVSAIATFHNTSHQAVLDAFLNLREAKEDDVVIFGNSISNGRHCLKIMIYDKNGTCKVFSLIDSDTGHPIAHIS